MLMLWFLTLLAMATPLHAQVDCRFSRVAEAPQALSVEGATEVIQIVKLVEQPDSPVVVTAVDLRGVTLNASPSQYTMDGTIVVEVMNISDLPISRVEIGRAAGWRDGFSSARWSFATTLGPGSRDVFTLSGRSGGGTAQPGELTVLLGIDAAFFEKCRYQPSVTAASLMRAQQRP